MKVYLTSVSTNEHEIENRAYQYIGSALDYICDSLKLLSKETQPECDFFERDYVKNYFTESLFNERVNCHSPYGEFTINKVKDNKHQFVFIPANQKEEYFIVCELEALNLLD